MRRDGRSLNSRAHCSPSSVWVPGVSQEVVILLPGVMLEEAFALIRSPTCSTLRALTARLQPGLLTLPAHKQLAFSRCQASGPPAAPCRAHRTLIVTPPPRFSALSVLQFDCLWLEGHRLTALACLQGYTSFGSLLHKAGQSKHHFCVHKLIFFSSFLCLWRLWMSNDQI